VQALLEVDATKRLTASEALRHPWLSKVGVSAEARASRFVAGSALSGRVALGLRSYMQAGPAARQCLQLLASRSSTSSAEPSSPGDAELGAAFLEADADGKGVVSLRDLVASMGSRASCAADRAEVEGLLQAADLGRSSSRSSFSYTEFLAACLCTRFSSTQELATATFRALDIGNVGRLYLADISRLFEGRLLEFLPRDRPFTLEEWTDGVRATDGIASPGQVVKLRLCVAGSRLMTDRSHRVRSLGPSLWSSTLVPPRSMVV